MNLFHLQHLVILLEFGVVSPNNSESATMATIDVYKSQLRSTSILTILYLDRHNLLSVCSIFVRIIIRWVFKCTSRGVQTEQWNECSRKCVCLRKESVDLSLGQTFPLDCCVFDWYVC